MTLNDKYLCLSHLLSTETPGYGGKKNFSCDPVNEISKGASSNSIEISLSNHIGTHIDYPIHFFDNASSSSSYSAEFWFFKKPHLVQRKASKAEIITVESWTELIPLDCDLLLIKTGFESFRNASEYWEYNPGFSPDLGQWLRKNRPQLRAIGFDVISLTSYQNRPLGRIAHQAFLNPKEVGNPILIIEDMHLSELKTSPVEVVALPLHLKNADGAPIHVVGKL